MPEMIGRMSRRTWICLLAALCGCSGRYEVDDRLAAETIRETLDAWKEGRPLAGLRDRRPPIVVQDPDWSDGVSLNEYRILDDVESQGPNFKCKVELTLMDGQGKPVVRNVGYTVTTNPALTVFRDLY